MKCLITDDQPVFMKKMVESFDYDIEIGVAKDGQEGLNEFFRAHKNNDPFDVLFLDLEMPIIRGEEMLIAIRCYEDTMGLDNIKVIVTSANTSANKAMELFKGGCDFYLRKPIDKGELNKAITFVYKGES
jgi:two-component system, chemotaxis family, chemotaxis protein CheY